MVPANQRSTKKKAGTQKARSALPKYPRHSVEKALRIPKAVLEQNAGKPCTDDESAKFLGLSSAKGPFAVEISSALKYGLLNRPTQGKIEVTPLARKILKPQADTDEQAGLREAVLNAPGISDVYKHYRGENLPDKSFFHNALHDSFGIPQDRIAEFEDIFIESLKKAALLSEQGGKYRLLDVLETSGDTAGQEDDLKKRGRSAGVAAGDTCFVMMPFAQPLGGYYDKIYEPAIRKAGLTPIRADSDIFGTGKIMEQVWSGIHAAKVLVAELTDRNPNVFYELGLAHAVGKPVVLVSANEEDVPFDLKHIRVIYYDKTDPFWGSKLVDKIAENIVSAINNPEEAAFSRVVEQG